VSQEPPHLGSHPITEARAPRAKKVDAFVGEIEELLREFPDLRATRLHEELVARGFEGGYTIVREHLNAIRPEPAKRAAKLVTTGPGVQGQFDWSPYRLVDGTPIYALSCVLSYSRRLYMRFTLDMRQPTLFRELRRAFEHHGGVASQYVTDSMPGVVDGWELNEPVLNVRAVGFWAHYGFSYHIAPPRNGAYKGKVERRFRYLDESFFNGRKFRTLEEANQVLAWWLENHPNRRVSPERLAEEQAALEGLPAHPYDDREVAHCIIDPYGYVHFDGNLYLASKKRVGVWACVRAGESEVEVLSAMADHLSRHPRAPRGAGLRVPPPKLIDILRRQVCRRKWR
jgi:transposase